MEPMEFSNTPEVQPVTIDGVYYEIRELTADSRAAYLKALTKTMQVKLIGTGEKDANGREIMRKEITVIDMDGAQKELLCGCMFRRDDAKGTFTPVTAKEVGSWRGKIIEQLVKRASDINGLEMPDDKLNEAAEKN